MTISTVINRKSDIPVGLAERVLGAHNVKGNGLSHTQEESHHEVQL